MYLTWGSSAPSPVAVPHYHGSEEGKSCWLLHVLHGQLKHHMGTRVEMSGGGVSVGESDVPAYKRVLQHLNGSVRKEGGGLCARGAVWGSRG